MVVIALHALCKVVGDFDPDRMDSVDVDTHLILIFDTDLVLVFVSLLYVVWNFVEVVDDCYGFVLGSHSVKSLHVDVVGQEWKFVAELVGEFEFGW